MLISTLKLEAKALKAFREDAETESESEEDVDADSRPQAEGGSQEIELESYGGGSSDRK